MIKKITFCFSLLIFLASCSIKTKEKFDILITNASIVNVIEGKVLTGKLIGISSDTIRLVGDMRSVSEYESIRQIDADNGFVMPGLWDMHVHLRGGDSLIAENRNLLPLYIAYGVTTVRDAGGDITPSVLAWREESAKGQMTGPRIFTSGPKLDGADPYWPGSIPVEDLEDVSLALDTLEQFQTDYVKAYNSTLPLDMYYEIIKESEKRGLKITGHVPDDANLFEAMELGLDGVEHAVYLLNMGSTMADSQGSEINGPLSMSDLLKGYDRDLALKNFKKLGDGNLYVTPTLYVYQMLQELYNTDHYTDSLLPMIGPKIIKTYERRLNYAKGRTPDRQEMGNEMLRRLKTMIQPMFNAGIHLVAGSDCGAFNSFVYPGESLHRELELFVASGLSPGQALSTSIINGPRFFGLEEFYGSIEPGKIGQLIILSGNPLIDIRQTRNIQAVIKGDRIYTREELGEMKKLYLN